MSETIQPINSHVLADSPGADSTRPASAMEVQEDVPERGTIRLIAIFSALAVSWMPP